MSISTVSRVLNSPNRVREETRSRVLNAIDELDFVPKAEAIARARKIVGRIGVLTPFFTFPSFVQRLRGMAQALNNTPYELIIYTVDSLDRLNGYLAMLPITRRLDGLIIMSPPVNEAAADRLRKNALESVLIGSSDSSINSITIDNCHGGALAAEYLLDKGHRRCAFIADAALPEYAIRPEESRLQGYREKLHQGSVELPDEYVKLPKISKPGLQEQVEDLLGLSPPPTAVFASTDDLAILVLKFARARNLRIPDDLAIIGFDDIDVAEHLDLTTIRQPLDESGKKAVQLLLARLADPSLSMKNVEMKLKVIPRGTA